MRVCVCLCALDCHLSMSIVHATFWQHSKCSFLCFKLFILSYFFFFFLLLVGHISHHVTIIRMHLVHAVNNRRKKSLFSYSRFQFNQSFAIFFLSQSMPRFIDCFYIFYIRLYVVVIIIICWCSHRCSCHGGWLN